MPGQGFQVGPLRPDYGDEWADLQCDQCAATWTAPIGAVCPWCLDAEQRQRQWQAELVLKAPEVDRDDRTRPGVITAWGQRLANAVKAGLVTEQQARTAWEREQ